MSKSPYLVLVLDADGRIVLNEVTNDPHISFDWKDPFPIWAHWEDMLENPLGTMVQNPNPIVTLSFVRNKRRE